MSDVTEPGGRSSAGAPATPGRAGVAAAAFASSILLAATFFGLCRDLLFFSSPWPVAVYVVAATGALLALALAPLLLLARLLPPAPRRALAVAVVASTPALVLAGFLLFAIESIREFSSLGGVLGAWLASLAAASAMLLLGSGRREALARASPLTAAVAGAGGAVVAIGLLASHARGLSGGGEQPERHVVLLVIDGMPSQLLQRYRPESSPTAFDAVAGRGRTFTAARTNFTFTNGFFFALYRGQLASQQEGSHLFAELEQAGVSSRWLTYHTNGVPEARAIRDYGGFRSTILTEQLTWWPWLLGIDYHTFLRAERDAYELHPRIKAMYQIVHGRRLFDQEGFFDRYLPGQIREVQDRARRSFLLAHVPVSASVNVQALEAGSSPQLGEQGREVFSEAARRDYRYDPESQDVVDVYRDHIRASLNVWGRGLDGLLDALEAEGRHRDTLIIVTSDHGQIFSKGKLFYGVHPDEEVARVPLFMFGPGLSGTETRAVDTLDIVRTIEEFLGSPAPRSKRGRNLLADFEEKYIPTLTTTAEGRGERFLVVFDRGRKYVVNLQGKEAPITGVTGGGYELEQQRPVRPDEPAMRLLLRATRRFFRQPPPAPWREPPGAARQGDQNQGSAAGST